MEPYFDKLQELAGAGVPFVSVTLIEAIGSTPQDAGSKMIVTAADGVVFGTVGGGRLEARAVEQAIAMLAPGVARTLFVNWNLQNDIKMTCGGAVKLYFEAYAFEPWQVAVFGAGHIAQAVVRTLLNLDCRVTCFDTRAEWVARLPESPKLTKRVTDDLPSRLDHVPAGTFVLMMTMGHSSDLPILVRALRRTDLPYVGVIGSAAKRAALRRGVLEAGIAAEAFDSVVCPMGLDLGTNHPYEIAISIAAQLIQRRDAVRKG